MRTRLVGVVAVLIVMVFAATAVFAGNVHFGPDFELGLGSLVASGKLAGLGNEDVFVQLTGTGTVTAQCENKGGNQAPGRNPVSVEVSISDAFSTTDNGSTKVELESPDPTVPPFEPSPTPKEAGCPNGNWKVVGIVDGSTDWTGARITVWEFFGLDNGDPILGDVLLDLVFSCVTTFANGIATDVECTEVEA